MEAPANWLEQLKADDTVIVSSHPYEYTGVVVRTTASQIIVKVAGWNIETRFRRRDGRSVGDDSFHSKYLQYPKPERIAAIREKEERLRLTRAITYRIESGKPITTANLRAMVAAMTQGEIEATSK